MIMSELATGKQPSPVAIADVIRRWACSPRRPRTRKDADREAAGDVSAEEHSERRREQERQFARPTGGCAKKRATVSRRSRRWAAFCA